MRFPTLEEAIACNEAVREPNEISPSADDDDLDRVGQALLRAQAETDPIEAAVIAAAQGEHVANEIRTLLTERTR